MADRLGDRRPPTYRVVQFLGHPQIAALPTGECIIPDPCHSDSPLAASMIGDFLCHGSWHLFQSSSSVNDVFVMTATNIQIAPSPRRIRLAGDASGSSTDSFLTLKIHGSPDPFLFSASSTHAVPSLSLSHPLELDLELVSAPSSSRPDSPFSDFGHEQFHSLSGHASSFAHEHDPSESFHSVLSGSDISGSEVDLDLGESEVGDNDLERWSSAGSEVSGSEISGSSWASAGVRSGSGSGGRRRC
ncbi:hypothetical protein K438DRAFT_1773375 [Mycena galopus ATCC 62051]|nr:hypothetical protein K438DRAFT_1773375 [Mycena galopus ATCC 62051]